ncbi:MAG: hypothetical protein Q3976_07190 [Corynebacterium sp.]|nr:hypothetical protein [Corynebacterium sp.]
MSLGKTARSIIVVIALCFLAVVGAMIANASSYTGTENKTSALEKRLHDDRHLGLTASGIVPEDYYGAGWLAIGAACPGATEDELLSVGLDEEIVERFNLQGGAIDADSNYLILAAADGSDMIFDVDQMEVADIDLCSFPLQQGMVSGAGNVVPIQSRILNFVHENGMSYLVS